MPTAYYAPPSVASRLVYLVWDDEGASEHGWYGALRTYCHLTTPAFELTQFLASHDTFLVYGRLASTYRLTKLIDKGVTVIRKRETGDHFLVLATYQKGAVNGAHP